MNLDKYVYANCFGHKIWRKLVVSKDFVVQKSSVLEEFAIFGDLSVFLALDLQSRHVAGLAVLGSEICFLALLDETVSEGVRDFQGIALDLLHFLFGHLGVDSQSGRLKFDSGDASALFIALSFNFSARSLLDHSDAALVAHGESLGSSLNNRSLCEDSALSHLKFLIGSTNFHLKLLSSGDSSGSDLGHFLGY